MVRMGFFVLLAVSTLGCTGLGGADTDANDTDSRDSDGTDTDGNDTECTEVSWYRDSDGDGYGDASELEQGCEALEGYVENDADCNDANADVNPDASEVCSNNVDDNCNDEADGCGLTGEIALNHADVEISGTTASSFGLVVAGLGDIDGDGLADVAIAGTEADSVYVFYGGPDADRTQSRADVSVLGDAADEAGFGSRFVAGDFDDDGTPDLVVSDSSIGGNVGRAYLFLGPLDDTEVSSDAWTTWLAYTQNSFFGSSLATGDWNGDGADDLLALSRLGVTYGDFGPVEKGMIDLVDLDEFAASIDFARVIASGGDLDGDGADDLAVTDSGEVSGDNLVYVTTGAWSGVGEISGGHLTATLAPVASGDSIGAALAMDGDLNGDGYDDLLVSAPAADGTVGSSGVVYAFFGPVDGTRGGGDADARLDGEAAGDSFGWSVAYVGDENADGAVDVLVGAPYAMGTVADAGAAYLYRGPFTPAVRPSPDATLRGADADLLTGYSVAGAGDYNGDGRDDLVIGSPGTSLSAGKAHVVYGVGY